MSTLEDFHTTSFLSFFSEIEDPRINRHKLYPLDEIFLTVLCAIICGSESWEDIEDFGKAKLYFLKQYLPFKNGTPSHDTFARVFSLIHPKDFKDCFLKWVESLQDSLPNIISIDGKTLRGSLDKTSGQKPLHLVSAFASNTRLVLAQEAVSKKSNEITSIPKLLEVLFLKGAIVTMDAMGCQTSLAKTITEKGGDYILALKKNQKSLYEEVDLLFKDSRELSCYESCDKGHGRVEIRKCFVSQEVSWLTKEKQWPKLSSIIKIESTRIIKDQSRTEVRYYLSSLTKGPKDHAFAIRSHWGIENSLHWVLDVVFSEDQNRIRKGNGPENMAIVRHSALNLIRQIEDSRTSLKRRKRRALYSDEYLANILMR